MIRGVSINFFFVSDDSHSQKGGEGLASLDGGFFGCLADRQNFIQPDLHPRGRRGCGGAGGRVRRPGRAGRL